MKYCGQSEGARRGKCKIVRINCFIKFKCFNSFRGSVLCCVSQSCVDLRRTASSSDRGRKAQTHTQKIDLINYLLLLLLTSLICIFLFDSFQFVQKSNAAPRSIFNCRIRERRDYDLLLSRCRRCRLRRRCNYFSSISCLLRDFCQYLSLANKCAHDYIRKSARENGFKSMSNFRRTVNAPKSNRTTEIYRKAMSLLVFDAVISSSDGHAMPLSLCEQMKMHSANTPHKQFECHQLNYVIIRSAQRTSHCNALCAGNAMFDCVKAFDTVCCLRWRGERLLKRHRVIKKISVLFAHFSASFQLFHSHTT